MSSKKDEYKIVYVLLLIVVGMTLLNYLLLSKLNSNITGAVSNSLSPNFSLSSGVIPKGEPAIYGKELGISYDDVNPKDLSKADQTISKLALYDTTLSLSEDLLKRYIDIAGSISCEYCCGAKSIIFSNGEAACGCAHSYAMRGLAKYLLTNHPDMTDEQILEELGKWKALFFPDIMIQKAQILAQQGIDFNYINLASNKYRGIEKSATNGEMVGGC